MGTSVAIVGATGAVGRELLTVLDQRRFPMQSLRLMASERSAGTAIEFHGRSIRIEAVTPDAFQGVNIAFFSAGAPVSRALAAGAVKAGAVIIDNTSAFRMKDGIPLVVPEVNPDQVRRHAGLIANPNCSTIILAVATFPLHKVNRIRRMVVSTYQAVSGAGAWGLHELEQQLRAHVSGAPITRQKFPHQILHNLFSHNSPISGNGYNEEENKLVNETRKIFADARVMLSATCVRVPVPRAHCESINLEFERPITPDEVRSILNRAPGVRVVDDRDANHFPMPLEASHQDDVLVGRIRQDISREDGRGIEMFISGDQLRKGAATNAVQIAEML